MAANDHHMHACTPSLDPINQPAVLTREILAIKCHHCHPMLQCEILAIKSLSGTKLRMSQNGCRRSSWNLMGVPGDYDTQTL